MFVLEIFEFLAIPIPAGPFCIFYFIVLCMYVYIYVCWNEMNLIQKSHYHAWLDSVKVRLNTNIRGMQVPSRYGTYVVSVERRDKRRDLVKREE